MGAGGIPDLIYSFHRCIDSGIKAYGIVGTGYVQIYGSWKTYNGNVVL